jgi:hypothetical protein
MASRKNIKCEYAHMQNAVSPSKQFSTELASGSRGESLSSPFPGSFFLDYDLYRDAQLWLPKAYITLPSEVSAYVNDAEFIISQHFATTQSWMPIISKRKIYHELGDDQSRSQSDFIILLYSMKLLMWWPPDMGSDRYPKSGGRTAAYSIVIQLLNEAEGAGILTLQLLQAKIFVCLYELGHGIYPAAYLSVGACARYAMALGIDGTNEVFRSNQVTDPMDLEEMRRCWWAIIILDRLVTFHSQIATRLPALTILHDAQTLGPLSSL